MKKIISLLAIILCVGGFQLQAQGTWEQVTHPITMDTLFGQVQFFNANEGWVKTGNGGLIHTTDGGNNWTRVYPFPNDSLYNMSDFAAGMSWGSTTHGYTLYNKGDLSNMFNSRGVYLLKTVNGGTNWSKHHLDSSGRVALQIQFVNSATGWITMFKMNEGIRMMRTNDGGQSWTVQPYPFVTSFSFLDSMVGWAITTWKDDSLTTTPTNWSVERTMDGGMTWQRKYTDTAVNVGNLLSIKAIDSNSCWAMGPTKTILRTSNGGTTFTKKVLPSAFTLNSKHKNMYAIDANHAWISEDPEDNSQNSVVHYTSDGGLNWITQSTDIAGSIFYIYFSDNGNGWLTGHSGDSVNQYPVIRKFNGLPSGAETVNSAINNIMIYPNPAKGWLHIQANSVINKAELLNLLGEKVLESQTTNGEIDIRGLSKGSYVLRVWTNNGVHVKKIMIH